MQFDFTNKQLDDLKEALNFASTMALAKSKTRIGNPHEKAEDAIQWGVKSRKYRYLLEVIRQEEKANA